MDLENLKRLAKETTLKPWKAGVLESHSLRTDENGKQFIDTRMHGCGPGHSYEDDDEDVNSTTLADCKFIAAANPQTILKLIESIETARSALIKADHLCNCEGNPDKRHCWIMANKAREALSRIDELLGGEDGSVQKDSP